MAIFIERRLVNDSVGHELLQLTHTLFQCSQAGHRCGNHVLDGFAGDGRDCLREVADLVSRRVCDATFVGLLKTCKDAE
jgi:hypothetical protein